MKQGDSNSLNFNFVIKDCLSTDAILTTFEVMRQLRPQFFDQKIYVDTIQRLMKEEKYQLIALYTHSS